MAGRYPDLAKDPKVAQLPGAQEKRELSEAEVAQKTKEFLPRSLSKDEKRVWNRVVPEFIREGRFKAIYVDFFANYCVTVSRMDRFLEHLDDPEVGWTYSTVGRNGQQFKSRPEAAQYNDDWRKWNSMVNQIGGSPATDARFHDLQPDLFGNDPYST